MTHEIIPSKVALFFDCILDNRADDLKQLIAEHFDFLQLDLAGVHSDDSTIDIDHLMAVSYRKNIYVSVNDTFWMVGIQKAFGLNNDCLQVLMDYSLLYSNDAALNFVFSVLDLVDIKSGTPYEQMFFEQLDGVFSNVPDTVVGEVLKLAHPNSLSDTRAGQYMCAQWANRLKQQLANCGTSTLGKKI